MRSILIIARKELLSTFRQRNLLLLMFLSPIVMVIIMGLAFSGLGGSGGPDFADIALAVVNQDEGVQLQEQLPVSASASSLADIEIVVGGQSINLGEQLLQNPALGLQAEVLDPGNVSLNFGNQLAAILLSQPISATGIVAGNGFGLSELTCPLLPANEQQAQMADGSLDDLFDAEAVLDAEAARAAVLRGDYAAAVIIPPDFSRRLIPDFRLSATGATSIDASTGASTGLVEVVANNGTPISASIVRAVVEGIVSQFERISVALDALMVTAFEMLVTEMPTGPEGSDGIGALLTPGVITRTLQSADASVLEPLGCLLSPGAGNIQLVQQPLNEAQERSNFGVLMVMLGGAQAVFFALFTGVFGINAIYEDRRQGTLQRVLVAPHPSSHVLFGRLLGNLLIVMSQLLILLMAFTTIVSIMEGEVTFIWGANVPALLAVVMGLSLLTTGLGVLIVGLAKSSEQVQLIGPLIIMFMGVLGGSFGTFVPIEVSQFSPTWWGIDAMIGLAEGNADIMFNLLVLFGVGALFALVGTYFFRRRMGL